MREMDFMGLAAGLYEVETRSVSPENLSGGKGCGAACELRDGSAGLAARDLGKGWKVNPYLHLQPGETITLADVLGEGAIKHIWLTPTGEWRGQILRCYWDGSDTPSVETPLGDFFAAGWGSYYQNNSLAVCVNPGKAFNCYWTMPFRKGFRVTLENRSLEATRVYYQIDYELFRVPPHLGYFHAQFRRVNPLPYGEVYTILDDIHGRGKYVGTYLAWGVHDNGWWGEGEVKFYLDGDREYPTLCGTGTEDYFCGSYDFEDPVHQDRYLPFSTPYTGLQVVEPDRLYGSQMRFGLYRWHLQDPIYFKQDLRVTIQALGWRSGGRYLPLKDDIASVAYWYQEAICQTMPALPDADALEIPFYPRRGITPLI
ncbi:MAG: glycoside hydrolase family 172 protein [Christensenellales bacterium]